MFCKKNVILLPISLLLLAYLKSAASTCSKIKVPTKIISPLKWAEIDSFLQSQTVYYDQAELAIKTELAQTRILLPENNETDEEDIHLDFKELAEKYGYSVEEHNVTTTDGYVLTMYRMKGDGPPVLLMHGVMTCALDWIANGPELALGYFLADKGYDVWFGNVRGSRYSMVNTEYSDQCAEFWDYSWHEMGIYDLPAMIDYILKETGKSKLSYVGMSQGTTMTYVLCSERPEYNDKFNIIISLAPVAWISHCKSPLIRLLSLEPDLVYTLISLLGVHNSAPKDNPLINTVRDILCANNIISKFLCSNVAFLTFGFDSGQINMNNLPIFMAYIPSGASAKEVVHYGQEVKSARFRQFDYGTNKNLKVYGSVNPPDYKVENIRAPVALFYSYADWISNVTDVNILADKLPNVVYKQSCENYNHADYVWAINADTVVNANILNLLQKYA